MLNLFWDERGVILGHYMPSGNTVNSATYADLLKNRLRPAIKSKRRGPLSIGVLLQHDKARPHTDSLHVRYAGREGTSRPAYRTLTYRERHIPLY